MSTVFVTAKNRLTSEASKFIPSDSLTNRTADMSSKAWAIVAGVGAGTGASCARLFAKHYPVLLLARNPKNFEDLAKEINSSGGRAVGISCDTSDGAQVKAAFEKVRQEDGFQGHLAAAIYNVGGTFIRKPFLELSESEYEAGWKANG